MRRLLCLPIVLALLAFAGCGGDDSSTSSAGGSDTTSTQTASSGGGMTAKEFIDASIPDQANAVKQLAGDNPDCADADVSPGSDFQVGVAISAAQASPDTPLSDVVAGQCGQG